MFKSSIVQFLLRLCSSRVTLRNIATALEKVNFESLLGVLVNLEVFLVLASWQWKHWQEKENRESTGI